MPSSPMEVATRNLLREMNSWTSLKIQVTKRGVNHIPRPGALKEYVNSSSYIETSGGERALDIISPLPGGGGSRVAAYCDGTRCAKVGYRGVSRQDSIAISRSFLNEGVAGSTDRPLPLNMFYVGKVPLHEALPRAKSLGEGEVAGRKTLVFAFPRVKWSMAVQDLDGATSIPLRLRSYLSRFDENRLEELRPAWTWTARSVEVVQGYHMPMRSEMVEFDRDSSGECTANPRYTVDITVDVLQYNAKYPKSTFWPVYQPGVQVIDGIKKSDYVVPGGREEADQAAASLAPAEATPPSSGADWISSGSLALGVVLIVAGLCRLPFRRR